MGYNVTAANAPTSDIACDEPAKDSITNIVDKAWANACETKYMLQEFLANFLGEPIDNNKIQDACCTGEKVFQIERTTDECVIMLKHIFIRMGY